MQPEQGNTTYERVVNLQNWCNNNSISVRGHTIIWDDEPTIQTWLKQITDPTTLFGYMQTRVNEVVTTFKVRSFEGFFGGGFGKGSEWQRSVGGGNGKALLVNSWRAEV